MQWNKEKEQIITDNYLTKTDRAIATILQEKYPDEAINPKSVEYHRQNMGLKKQGGFPAKAKNNDEKVIPIFLDKKRADIINWRNWFENLKEKQELHRRASSSQDEATIKIETDKKVVICFSADWHTGSVAVNYRELQLNLEKILGTDRVFMITVGDLLDNFRKFYSLQPILAQIISPREQGEVLQSILNEFIKKKKWLCACWGNHDIERDEKMYGESPIKNLLANKLIYFNGKGTLNLIVGKQKYVIRMSHEFKGYSIYNPNHSMNRELKWNTPFADVIVGAHKHQPAVQNFYEYNQPKCLIQVGTFQTDDGFAKRWYGKGIIGVPAVVFHPDKHHCFVYPSLEELLEEF